MLRRDEILQAFFTIVLFLAVDSSPVEEKPVAINSDNGTESLISTNLVFLGERSGRKFYAANVPATWMQSLTACHGQSLSLASFLNQDEMNFVAQKLRERTDWQFPWFWTCGTDFFGEGQYKWLMNNYPINPRFITSQFSQVPERTKNCVQLSIRQKDRNLLFDFSCDDKTALPLCLGF